MEREELMQGNGFFAFYNPYCVDSEGNRWSETTLVDHKDFYHEYRVLKEDFRKEYKILVPQGLEMCVEFFNKQRIKYGSSQSTSKIYESEL